jgi:hypothetical protein
MIEFLLTNWWIYIPIILVLVFLTVRNNQKVKYIKQERALRELDPVARQQKIAELKKNPSKLDTFASKFGLKGILTYIFPKK